MRATRTLVKASASNRAYGTCVSGWAVNYYTIKRNQYTEKAHTSCPWNNEDWNVEPIGRARVEIVPAVPASSYQYKRNHLNPTE